MKLKLYQEIQLVRDVPSENLRTGDVAMLVHHPHPRGGEEAARLEVFNAVGKSIAVATVPASAIGLLRADQVPAVRMSCNRYEIEAPAAYRPFRLIRPARFPRTTVGMPCRFGYTG